MEHLPPALPHGEPTEVLADVFLVTGAMRTVPRGVERQFSRNMTVGWEGNAPTLITAIRLGEKGPARLDTRGRVFAL